MQRIKTWIRENPHVWWTLVLPVYLTLFFIIEHFIKDNYWATQTSIDYHIPFIPQFIVIYDSWSFLLFALGIYLIVKDPEGFRRYMWTILLTFFTATAFCALVPNGQDLRPAEFARHDFFIWLVQRIYTADTNTNVCPSIHVIGSFAVYFAARDIRRFRAKGWRLGFLTMAVLISLSTVFLKQHSVLDVLAGLAVCAAAYPLVYRTPARRTAPLVVQAMEMEQSRSPQL